VSETKVTLSPGQPAPGFRLAGDDDREHSLEEFRGRRVVLYFYPKDDTPGCTTEACDFRDLHGELAGKDVVVIGVSPDPVASHKRFKAKHGLPFLLLSDPGALVARSYGAFGEKVLYGRRSEGLIRSTFVIGPDGCLQAVYPKVSAKGHAAAVAGRL
jgi:peroxiredoxin Q/BCP